MLLLKFDRLDIPEFPLLPDSVSSVLGLLRRSADFSVAGLCFLPKHISSFYSSGGVFEKSSSKSNFIIELVGMFGVSFSKPPCIKTNWSMAQTLWRCLYRELNLRHSLDSVS